MQRKNLWNILFGEGREAQGEETFDLAFSSIIVSVFTFTLEILLPLVIDVSQIPFPKATLISQHQKNTQACFFMGIIT